MTDITGREPALSGDSEVTGREPELELYKAWALIHHRQYEAAYVNIGVFTIKECQRVLVEYVSDRYEGVFKWNGGQVVRSDKWDGRAFGFVHRYGKPRR